MQANKQNITIETVEKCLRGCKEVVTELMNTKKKLQVS